MNIDIILTQFLIRKLNIYIFFLIKSYKKKEGEKNFFRFIFFVKGIIRKIMMIIKVYEKKNLGKISFFQYVSSSVQYLKNIIFSQKTETK